MPDVVFGVIVGTITLVQTALDSWPTDTITVRMPFTLLVTVHLGSFYLRMLW